MKSVVKSSTLIKICFCWHKKAHNNRTDLRVHAILCFRMKQFEGFDSVRKAATDKVSQRRRGSQSKDHVGAGASARVSAAASATTSVPSASTNGADNAAATRPPASVSSGTPSLSVEEESDHNAEAGVDAAAISSLPLSSLTVVLPSALKERGDADSDSSGSTRSKPPISRDPVLITKASESEECREDSRNDTNKQTNSREDSSEEDPLVTLESLAQLSSLRLDDLFFAADVMRRG
jgi:hypothetical protein